ncbi:hypothetical protein BASA81_000506 [Batrachochytrium salamandrivorans]|nr:hypothetical protein BASA81_000506 [Batrachochytrium salamandrivorans]
MLEVLAGPISVLGLVCGYYSLGRGQHHNLASALYFSLSLLLISFFLLLLSSLLVPMGATTTGKRHAQVSLFPKRITLPLLIRAAMVSLATTVWAYCCSHVAAYQVVLGELLVQTAATTKLPNQIRHLGSGAVGLLVVGLIAKGLVHHLAGLGSVAVRELFGLFRDAHVLLMGGAMSLTGWLVVLLITKSKYHESRLQLPLVVLCALLWVVFPKRFSSPSLLSPTKLWLITVGFGLMLQVCLAVPPLSHLPVLVLCCAAYCTFILTVVAKPEGPLLPIIHTTAGEVGDKKQQQLYKTWWMISFWRDLSKDSRRIAAFLVLTLGFMLVELIMGLYTNSLGLISDAGHMFFDSAALLIGLVASIVASKNRPDSYYTFGYDRLQLLAGFVNAIFLAFVSVFVLSESLERFTAPPEIKTDGLLLTSVLGLVINGIGLVFFHDHSHGHGGDEACTHGHSHAGNENMQGVFLHVLADALGSVGVIVSSLLVQYKGWYIADPICSFFVSMLIFASVIPLLRSTTNSLLLRTPKEVEIKFNSLLERLKRKPGVVRIVSAHVWRYSPKVLVSTCSVVVSDREKRDETCAWLLRAFRDEIGATDVTVQVSTTMGGNTNEDEHNT